MRFVAPVSLRNDLGDVLVRARDHVVVVHVPYLLEPAVEAKADVVRRRVRPALAVPQLERLRDLYLLGDLTKPEYLLRRQAIEEQLQRAKPPANPNIDRARKLLEDFASFWEVETDPNERRKLTGNLFEHVSQKDGRVVAVKPHAAFASYFTSLRAAEEKPPKGGLKSEVTTTGATGEGSGACTSGD